MVAPDSRHMVIRRDTHVTEHSGWVPAPSITDTAEREHGDPTCAKLVGGNHLPHLISTASIRIPEHALTGSSIIEAADAGAKTLVTACELLSAFAIAKPTTEVSGIPKVDGAGSGSGRLG